MNVNTKLVLLPILGALAVAFLACSSGSGIAAHVDAGTDAKDDGGDDATLEAEVGADADRSIDAGCFAALGSNAPDAEVAQIYGSCIPHIKDASTSVCYESGHVGDLPDSGGVPAMLGMTCAGAPINGTWASHPCDRTGAVFGCLTVTTVGDVCAAVTTTWYYPPATSGDEQADCPLPFTVVFP